MIRITCILGFAALLFITGCTTGVSPEEITQKELVCRLENGVTAEAPDHPVYKRELHRTLLGIGWVVTEFFAPIKPVHETEPVLKSKEHPTGLFGGINEDFIESRYEWTQSYYVSRTNEYRLCPGLNIGSWDLISIGLIKFDGGHDSSFNEITVKATRVESKHTFIDHDGKTKPVMVFIRSED